MALIYIVVVGVLLLALFGFVYGVWVLAKMLLADKRQRCPRCNGVLAGNQCEICHWPERRTDPAAGIGIFSASA